MRRDPLDRVDVASMDFGIGVLRGAISLIQPLRDKPEQAELAIEHIRRAARLLEKLQRESWKRRLPSKCPRVARGDRRTDHPLTEEIAPR